MALGYNRGVQVLRRALAPWARAALAGVVLAGALAGGRARAADLTPPLPPEARAHYESAMAHYAAKEYEAAISELALAYAAEPRREILFAQAQATRLAGDCPAALPLYERFLATSPPARQVEATRIAVARCAALAAQPPAKGAPAMKGTPPNATAPADGTVGGRPLATPALPLTTAVAPGAKPPVVPGLEQGGLPPSRPPPAARRWYRDRVGGVLAAAALVTAATGAVLLTSARAADRMARASGDLQSYADQHAPAEDRERWGLTGVLVGGALAVGAASRYLWVGLGDGGRGLTVEGRF